MHESVQAMGERLANKIPFVGCGVHRFERTGRAQFMTLLRHGLSPFSKVLDIGCGALCGGYWLIHFLEPGGYCGIEPNRAMLEAGLAELLEPELVAHKRPRFDHGTSYAFSVFGERFDFMIAHSIWTHAPKSAIETMLDGFAAHAAPAGVFLASYKRPIPLVRPDYLGTSWVGASHESTTPGIVRHRLAWVREACARRGLCATDTGERIHAQRWLRIEREKGSGAFSSERQAVVLTRAGEERAPDPFSPR